MLKEYINFEIQIRSLGLGRYALDVSCPLGGEDSGSLTLPTENPAYQALAERLARFDTDEETLLELGRLLFDALFQGSRKDVYVRSQGGLGPGQGIRMRFNIAAGEVAAASLPWEFMVDPYQGPLAMLGVSIVRYFPLQGRVPTLATSLPLKVLLTGAQIPPKPVVDDELQTIQAALGKLGDQVQMTIEPHLTTSKLQDLLSEGFHIWHFVGHGDFSKDGKTGQLLFEDENGDADPVSAMQLRVLLDGSEVRLVVLDSCNSGKLLVDPFRSVAPALIRAQTPAVIAMQFSVPQQATRTFASKFYRAVASGAPIDACVTEGRRAVMGVTGLGAPDWGIPVVYTRVPDGRLFELPEPTGAQAGARQASSGGVTISIGEGNIIQDHAINVSEVGTITKGSSEGGTTAPDEQATRIGELRGRMRELRRRLHGREVQLARYGYAADPSISMEIEDLKQELLGLQRELQQLGG